MRIRLESIGCRLNAGEMDALASRLCSMGHKVVSRPASAEICIFNSCTVTSTAASKSRQAIRRLRKELPETFLLVTGCDSELDPERARSAGANLVISNHDKDRIAEVLVETGILRESVEPTSTQGGPVERNASGRARSFVKVQDGCDHSCSYCVVTIARGPGRSLPVEDVVHEVKRQVEAGAQEVVFTGVHLGSYGRDSEPRSSLAELVQRVLQATDIQRLRLSSVEPWDVDDRLIEEFSDPRLQPHLHLPLQSGCDATLRRMGRSLNANKYRELISRIKDQVTNVAISTDVMVGFPGESDDEFSQSHDFIAKAGFSRLHVFRFSPREGTVAASLPDQVTGSVSKERSETIRLLGLRLQRSFAAEQVGRTTQILWETLESRAGREHWSGLTPNYVRVYALTDGVLDLRNLITPARLDHALEDGCLLGTIADSLNSGVSVELFKAPKLPVI